MKPVAPTVSFALRTARGEQRRIRSFLKQVTDLGVVVEDLPPESVRALREAEKFLGRYLDALAHETPTPEQLDGVIEALGGIDKVVKNAMAEILRSLGWRPDPADGSRREEPPPPGRRSRPRRGTEGAEIIPFPGPRPRK